MDPLTFTLFPPPFCLPFPSCPPSPTVSITSAGPCRYPPLLLSPLCSWLACLESLPHFSKQSALPPTHIGAAGRCRRRSHSCSACCHQQFRPFTLPGLLTVSGATFSFLKLFTLFMSKVCSRLLSEPCTCLFPVLSAHLTLLVPSLCGSSPRCQENETPTPSFDLGGIPVTWFPLSSQPSLSAPHCRT